MALDLRSNKLIGRHNEKLRLPIASVTKMVTACYYLTNNQKLDRFKTELFIDGAVKDDVLFGDLYLKGYGDPTLKTDDLSLFIDAVKKLEASTSLYEATSLPTPSSKDLERGKTISLKLLGVVWPP